MTLLPLVEASTAIKAHTALALAMFFAGGAQLMLQKGTTAHAVIGWIWVMGMGGVAVSSFFISAFPIVWGFGPIHLISVFVLVMVPVAVLQARRGNIRRHARAMTITYLGALLVAGAFTLLPGRIMHEVMFGH